MHTQWVWEIGTDGSTPWIRTAVTRVAARIVLRVLAALLLLAAPSAAQSPAASATPTPAAAIASPVERQHPPGSPVTTSPLVGTPSPVAARSPAAQSSPVHATVAPPSASARAASPSPVPSPSPSPHPFPIRSPAPSPVPPGTPFLDPCLGIQLTIPPGYSRPKGPTPPVNFCLLGPVDPPFRSNVTLVIDAAPGSLEQYVERLLHPPRAMPRCTARIFGLTTIAGRSAIVLTDEITYRLLPLRNLQAVVEIGNYKYVITGTTLANRHVAFQKLFFDLLQTVRIGPRAPPSPHGTLWMHPALRFTWRLPVGFEPVPKPPAALAVLFSGPVEAAFPLAAEARVIPRPPEYEPARLEATLKGVLAHGAQATNTERAVVSGRVTTAPGLELEVRSRVADREVRELALHLPVGDSLRVATFFCPVEALPLWRHSLMESLATFGRMVHAPAPAASKATPPPRSPGAPTARPPSPPSPALTGVPPGPPTPRATAPPDAPRRP